MSFSPPRPGQNVNTCITMSTLHPRGVLMIGEYVQISSTAMTCDLTVNVCMCLCKQSHFLKFTEFKMQLESAGDFLTCRGSQLYNNSFCTFKILHKIYFLFN